ncbi:MAG: LysR substrate-binding domain-containing protein [Pseudomonadota bacterium]
MPKLSEFTERHPHIDILVRTSDESEEKHPTDADLSIRLFKSPPKGLESTPLFPLRMAPTGSPDFKKSLQVKNKRIVSPFPLLVHESRPKAWKQWSQAAGIDLPADSKVTRLDSMIAVVRAVERGIGAALVPVPIADQWFRQGSIVRLFDDELVADTRYFLVSHPDSSELPEIRLLSDWIVDTFSIAA